MLFGTANQLCHSLFLSSLIKPSVSLFPLSHHWFPPNSLPSTFSIFILFYLVFLSLSMLKTLGVHNLFHTHFFPDIFLTSTLFSPYLSYSHLTCTTKIEIILLYLLSFIRALPWYFAFPQVKGKYRYLIMCLIWRFIVKNKRTQKYNNRMGQNTATSKIEKNVIANEIQTAFVQLYQYLNSGSLRANGLQVRNKILMTTVRIRVLIRKIKIAFEM